MMHVETLKFPVLSDEEIESLRKNLQEGDYEFEIANIELKHAKTSNNKMAALELNVFDFEGNKHIVFDYLVPTTQMVWKIKHFYESIGMVNHYQLGIIDPSVLKGKIGYLRIKIEKTEKFGSRPKVIDYIQQNQLSNEDISF